MSAPIVPIGAIGGITPATATPEIPSTSGTDFAKALGTGLDDVASAQYNADTLAVQAATGQLVDPAQYTVAATQAQLMTQLATTLTTKGVDAFNQIMNMQA